VPGSRLARLRARLSPPASAARVSLLATAFVVLQQAVPLGAKLTAEPTAPQDFSWDMFGKKVECPVLQAHAVLANGSSKPLNLEQAFPKWSHLRRLLVRERLERFASYVCEGMRSRHGVARELHFTIECRNLGEEQTFVLSDPAHDWCSGPPEGSEP
jgi:hypothetical protein